MRIQLALPCLALACALLSAAATTAARDCGHTLASVPVSIKTILQPVYASGAQGSELDAARRQLELLMLESAHCKLSAQSMTRRSDAAEAELAEWASLDQWLYRLVNFVEMSSKGNDSNDWKREFEIFAEVYELEL